MSPQPTLELALVQGPLHWQDVEANLMHFSQVLKSLAQRPDLVILPEMFTTGFTMKPQALAKHSWQLAQKWLQAESERMQCAICGSVVAEQEGRFYNRFLWAEPGKVISPYDKRHLFRMAGEHEVYTPGNQRELIDYKGWRIMPRICYDLRFPVWSRSAEAHLQIYVANWPKPRVSAWDALLKARAIENLCYVAGVNRIGTDGNEVPYSGHSAVIDYIGAYMGVEPNEEESIIRAQLNMEDLLAFRKKFPAYLDADRFKIDI